MNNETVPRSIRHCFAVMRYGYFEVTNFKDIEKFQAY